MKYTLANAPYIGLAGLVTGLQEAYFKFEVRQLVVAISLPDMKLDANSVFPRHLFCANQASDSH